MSGATRIATLHADLDRSELRLKLAVARGNWRDAAWYANEAARLEGELAATREEPTPVATAIKSTG